jgi:hypothetical protein
MPDHAIRSTWWYQFFVRGGRPTLLWVAVAAAAWALFVGEIVDKPMPDAKTIIVLTFVGALYGIRSFEKTKGVA